MNRIQSIIKKSRSLVKSGINPYEIGEHYFNNPDAEVEELAKQRLKDCSECLTLEPIDMWKIEDVRIPELSNKSCNKCGCIAPYKFRQSIDKCSKWKQ